MTDIFNNDNLNTDAKIKNSANKCDNQIVMKTFYNIGLCTSVNINKKCDPPQCNKRYDNLRTVQDTKI